MRFSGLACLVVAESMLSGVSAATLNNPFEGAGQENEKRAKCNANNCARAVTGTANGLQATRLADCSSFMQCLVTPAAVTVTDTVTISIEAETTETSFYTITRVDSPSPISVSPVGPIQKRTDAADAAPLTNCPTAVPTYASACSGTVRYSSACSCGGVTQSYRTLSGAVSTVTSTVTRTKPAGFTITTEVTIPGPTQTAGQGTYLTVANPTGRFRLRTVGEEYNNLYAVGSTGSNVRGWIWFAVTGTNSYFEINSTTGYITDFGYQFVKQKVGTVGGEIGTPYIRDDSTFGPVTFRTVSNDGGVTRWMAALGTNSQAKIQVCPPDEDHSYAPWFWLGSQDREGCTQVTLKIVPL